MNDNLQAALVDVILKATETVEAAGAFIMAEAPAVAQEILRYEFYLGILALCFGLFIILLPTVLIVVGIRSKWEGEGLTVVTIFGSVIGYFAGVMIITCNLQWLHIWLAPKLYLIKYASALIK